MTVVEFSADAPLTEPLLDYAERLCRERLQAYAAAPHDAEEHANVEQSVLAGGYAYRQVAELVQNAADAIVDDEQGGSGRIVIMVDDLGLWAANTGAPIDRAGVKALLNANASGKRAGQIGRFGLGFKSLLKLGGDIAVLSRSVSLLFDPDACRAKVRALVGLAADAPAPALRLATPLDWRAGVSSVIGADRFEWATTVVFAQLRAADARARVTEEMARFPAAFLLFLPGDVELVLKAGEVERHLRRRTDSDGALIIEDLSDPTAAAQRWRVFQTRVRINDPAALDDATSVHAREAVPLIWAAPLGNAPAVAGRFFAFFPTQTETRTLGILNAPWKLNSDRTALIPGDWNRALMQAAADFIVDNLETLAGPEDPGAILDAYPRELLTQGDTAAPLVSALWDRLERDARLPDCNGEFKPARDLFRPPVDAPELGLAWSRLADEEACATHLHPGCAATAARSGRLDQLTRRLTTAVSSSDAPCLQRTGPQPWFEHAICADPDDARPVFALVDAFARAAPGSTWDHIRDRLRMIPSSDGGLLTAPESTLSPDGAEPLRPVHPELVADPETRRILEDRFHLRDAAETDWERLLDARVAVAQQSEDWSEVWNLLRRMPWDVLDEVLGWTPVSVRSLNGWAEPDHCIRSGNLLTTSDLDDLEDDRRPLVAAWLVDEDYHRGDTAILTKLGVTGAPRLDWKQFWAAPPETDPVSSAWLAGWRRKWTEAYHVSLDRRPELTRLGPSGYKLPSGWELLVLLEGDALRRITAHLLTAAAQAGVFNLAAVTFSHNSRPGSWATAGYPHPLWALMLDRGKLAVGAGDIDFGSLLLQDIAVRASYLPGLAGQATALAALQASSGDFVSARDASAVWKDWLELAALEPTADALTELWEAAAADEVAPKQIAGCEGPVDLSGVLVSRTVRDAAAAVAAGHNSVVLSRNAGMLWVRNGARWLDDVAGVDWTPGEAGSEAILLVEAEPAVSEVLTEDARAHAALLFVATLESRIGGTATAMDWSCEADRVLVLESAYRDRSWRDRVALLLEAAAASGWISGDNALKRVLTGGVSARRRAVADADDLPGRLLAAVGGPAVLLALFDPEIQTELGGDDSRLAQVAITLFGPALFAETSIRQAMENHGLQPPQRWGGETAAAFIAEIGFPPDFAVAAGSRREPEMVVSGPLQLKPLHDYQEHVVQGLDELLAETGERRRRAVISLPTGAGKTRVAAQTAVTRTLATEAPNRLVVWIAQTDELCEQAVQCFRELWANLGPKGDNLRIVRLWGGQTNPQASERHEPTVVVASIQTLTSRMNGPGIEWLSQPGLLVIDECHHALTPSYTGLFRWLNPDATTEPEPPVVGLSATPFRGRNDDETAQLARRFDGRLLPKDQSGLFETLQDKGVLAKFRYTRLDMNTPFALTIEEERHWETFKVLPESAMERLGENRERNDLIIQAMATASEKSALVFATSVSHARKLAARLNVLGVGAAVVSGETDRSSRRWFISAFQKGDLRVLCNHSALTTGFDAPATDLIVIARPVFSPSLYMQMVGRGLRGPLNGGKSACRILTVQDNLERFSDELAHHYFEKYYID